MHNGAQATSKSQILTCYEAKTAKSCVGPPKFSISQVSVKGINATKVLDEKKQVYLNVSVLMNDQSFLSCVPV